MNDKWISMSEIARRLDLSRPTVRKLLADGEIPGLVAHFGTARVERETFDRWHAKSRKAS